MFKGVKPRTHLILDIGLFCLLVALALTALLGHTTPAGGGHLGFMLSRIHEIAGIGLCLVVSLHLLMHLPWIQAQLKRLLHAPERAG